MFAQQGFFGGPPSRAIEGAVRYTSADAVANLAALGLCSAAALFLLDRYLAHLARRA